MTCKVCGKKVAILIKFNNICNSTLLIRKKCILPTVKLSFYQCLSCGFVFTNPVFSNDELYIENSFEIHSKNPKHIKEIIDYIDFNITDKSLIVDIGGGDGSFISCLANFKTLLVVEPGPGVFSIPKAKVKYVHNYFDSYQSKKIKLKYGGASVITCRHVIEHIVDLKPFFNGVNHLLKKNGLLVIEVPDFDMQVRQGDFTQFWEQHVNYFNIATLTIILMEFGFKVVKHKGVSYGSGSIVVYAHKSNHFNNLNYAVGDIQQRSKYFIDRVSSSIMKIREEIIRFFDDGKVIVIFGAGHITSTFLSIINLQDSMIKFILDDNKNKSDHFLNGHIPIIKPNKAVFDIIDVCIIPPMNTPIEVIIKKCKYKGKKTLTFIDIRKYFEFENPQKISELFL